MVEEHRRQDHPRSEANFFSKLFFWTELRIGIKSRKRDFTETDLYLPLKNHQSKDLCEKLEAAWESEENFKKNPSLLRALIDSFGNEFFLYGIVYFPVYVGITLLQPYCLSQLLKHYLSEDTSIPSEAYIWATLLILVQFVDALSSNVFSMGMLSLGMKIRIACGSLIYRRCLQLKKEAFKNIKVGQIVNLLSNDVKRFDKSFTVLHFIWIGPLQLLFAGIYLANTLGQTALAGIYIICGVILLQIGLSKKISTQRKLVAVNTDRRMCLMNDVITNIKFIKMNTWELQYLKKITSVRNSELIHLKKANVLRLANTTFKFFLTEICSYFCILSAVSSNIPLTSDFVFVIRTLFDSVKTSVAVKLPEAVLQLAEVGMTIKRLQEVLILDHGKNLQIADSFTNNCVLKSVSPLLKGPPRIYGSSISVAGRLLDGINFSVLPGEVVGIMGSPSSGKTTLLQVIMKEIEILEGSLDIRGRISYTSQEPWIFPFSTKKNILFGERLDQEKYWNIAKICDLRLDDKKIITSDSSQVSRIHFARGVYREADIYLFDEPLSQVDNSTAKEILQECVETYLKDKCIVIVSPHVPALKCVQKIFYLSQGKLIIKPKRKKSEKENIDFQIRHDEKNCYGTLSRNFSNVGNDNKLQVCKSYCKFGGGKFVICQIYLVVTMFHILIRIVDYFLAFWVDLEEVPESSSQLKYLFPTERCIYIYTILISCLIITTGLSTRMFLRFTTQASKYLHNMLISNVLCRTMTFFHIGSHGTLLNTFSKDLGEVDENIPLDLKNTIEMSLNVCATGLIICSLNYYMILPTLLLFIICLFLNKLFNGSTLSKLQATNQSHVYTHLAATIESMPSFRSSNVQKFLEEEFDRHQNLHTSAFYMNMATEAAFSFWSNLTRVAYTGLTIFSFFVVRSLTGNVGLAITQSSDFVIIEEALKAWNDLHNNIITIDRMMKYSALHIEPKSTAITFSKIWPKFGNLEFHAVTMKHADGFPVLKQVSFVIQAGEKIGIITDTISTSAIISVLFRFFHFYGNVFIDDVDIKTLPLNLLRSKISIIPKKPVLLQGTLRQNLDPRDEFNDLQIWQALEIVHLEEHVCKLPQKLNTEVSEDDSYFLPEQKPLLYLARIILKDPKIIIIDKTSFNNNLRTENVIQSVIKRMFRSSTVLTIGVNLKDVISQDKVLILKGGRVVSFCDPLKLQQVSRNC